MTPRRTAPPHLLAILLLCLGSSAIQAQEVVSLTAGAGEHTQFLHSALTLGLPCALPLRRDASLCLLGSANLGLWRTRGQGAGSGRDLIVDFGVTPSLRWAPKGGGLFVEGGLGLHWLTPRFANRQRELSTHLQFATHLGVGTRLNEGMDVFAAVQHYSNGGLRQPNDGMNFFFVRISCAF